MAVRGLRNAKPFGVTSAGHKFGATVGADQHAPGHRLSPRSTNHRGTFVRHADARSHLSLTPMSAPAQPASARSVDPLSPGISKAERLQEREMGTTGTALGRRKCTNSASSSGLVPKTPLSGRHCPVSGTRNSVLMPDGMLGGQWISRRVPPRNAVHLKAKVELSPTDCIIFQNFA
jgi:hypothetical protein